MGDSEPSIEGVAFIADAPVPGNYTLTSINLATGSKKTLQLERNSALNALALSPSGDTIIIAERVEQAISCIATSTMTTIHRLKFDDHVSCVAWSLDGQYIAAGMMYGEVIIINPSDHSITEKVKSHDPSSTINDISFNRTSDKLVAGLFDKTAIIYTVPDLTVLTTFEEHTWVITFALFLHDDRVVTGSYDQTIRVWGAEGNTINIIKEHSDWVLSLAVSPDGKVLASGGFDKKICIYNVDTYEMTASISCDGPVDSLCFVNSDIVLAGVDGSEMIAVDVQTGKVIKKYEGKYAWPSIGIRAGPEPAIVSSLFGVSTYVTSHLHTLAFSAAYHPMISIACC